MRINRSEVVTIREWKEGGAPKTHYIRKKDYRTHFTWWERVVMFLTFQR